MSETIRFECGSCGRHFSVPPEMAGRKAKCACGQVQAVPAAARELVPVDEPDEEREPRRRRPSKSRLPLILAIAFGAAILLGLGGFFVYQRMTSLKIKECYAIDMVVLLEGRQIKAVPLAIRTGAKLGDSDVKDFEIVSPEGQKYGDARIYELGKEEWLVIVVPEKALSGGGWKLRRKSNNETAELPAIIAEKKINDFK